MQTPQAAFERFEAAYHDLGKSLSGKTSRIAQNRDGPNLELVRDAQADVDAMDALLSQMDNDVVLFPFHMKTKYVPMLRRLKTAFAGQKQDLQRLTNGQVYKAPGSSRAQVLNTKNASGRVDQRIDGILSVNDESEQIGTNVSLRLREQREQLLHSRDGLDNIGAVVSQAKSVMTRMGQRVVTDKMIQGSIIVLELFLIGVIVYRKFLS